MVKYIKRKSDGKFLQSLENNTWVDTQLEALKMSYKECETIKESLYSNYNIDELEEIVNMLEWKELTDEERKELKNLLKNK